jgi:hypothetical protein
MKMKMKMMKKFAIFFFFQTVVWGVGGLLTVTEKVEQVAWTALSDSRPSRSE